MTRLLAWFLHRPRKASLGVPVLGIQCWWRFLPVAPRNGCSKNCTFMSWRRKATIMPMRRTLAMLLMALFSFSLISPVVLASDPESNLPACCRRGGKHHCAMMAMQSESPSGPSVQTGGCPLFPSPGAIPAGPAVSLPGFFQAIFTGLLSYSDFLPSTKTLCLSSYSRAGQKRGPPASIS